MDILNGKNYYTCQQSEGNEYRLAYLESVRSFIESEYESAVAQRLLFCPPEKMAADRESFRKKYMEMIGSPRYPRDIPRSEREFVAKDDFCEIYRVKTEVLPNFWAYGMLMLPCGVEGRLPLVIAQHGGGGTPEKCSDMWGENNYGLFVKRALIENFAVFAPQIMVWSFNVPDEQGQAKSDIDYGHRRDHDNKLKRLGLSLTGLEIFCIRREIDALCADPRIDGEHIGMMGLSYGGYFTLYTMAADTRIKAGYAGAFFNDRASECFFDWGYKNSAKTFQDAEVAGLCAPRRLILDVGKNDPVFKYEGSVGEAARAARYYEAAGASEQLTYHLYDGGHRFDLESTGFADFFAAIRKA